MELIIIINEPIHVSTLSLSHRRYPVLTLLSMISHSPFSSTISHSLIYDIRLSLSHLRYPTLTLSSTISHSLIYDIRLTLIYDIIDIILSPSHL